MPLDNIIAMGFPFASGKQRWLSGLKMPELFLPVVVAFIIAAASAIVAVRWGEERLALHVSLTGMLLLGTLAVLIVVY